MRAYSHVGSRDELAHTEAGKAVQVEQRHMEEHGSIGNIHDVFATVDDYVQFVSHFLTMADVRVQDVLCCSALWKHRLREARFCNAFSRSEIVSGIHIAHVTLRFQRFLCLDFVSETRNFSFATE